MMEHLYDRHLYRNSLPLEKVVHVLNLNDWREFVFLIAQALMRAKFSAQKITEARPPQAAELTALKFGSNFFVNLD